MVAFGRNALRKLQQNMYFVCNRVPLQLPQNIREFFQAPASAGRPRRLRAGPGVCGQAPASADFLYLAAVDSQAAHFQSVPCFQPSFPSINTASLYHQPQRLHLALLFGRAAGGVNAGGIDAAVAQNICEAHHIPVSFVVRHGEQMP